MKTAKNSLIAGAALLVLAGCNGTDDNNTKASAEDNPQAAFLGNLSAYCGKAFAGKLVSKDEADKDFAGKDMRIHFASCSDSEIKIPFHVEMEPGKWNRSRTWIISKTDSGLRLKHDHRHEDGTSDKVTIYGGDTAAEAKGSATQQEFPVDEESITMFKANDLAASVTNIWAVEIGAADSDAPKYAYELRRENRHFRVEFDLTKPVETPPLPWGWQE